ncbi:uromodulin-like [Oculina patagonica]
MTELAASISKIEDLTYYVPRKQTDICCCYGMLWETERNYPEMKLLEVDGCKNYTVLSEADRAQGNAVKDYLCDKGLVTGWYRFQGAAGDRMADNCVMKYRCGTEYPGWLYGAHPTVAEGVVTRQVCYTGWVDCCYSRNNIKVQNCNGYFVYELQKPPTCNLRYCGNAGAVDGCKNYTVLSEADRAQGNAVKDYLCDKGLVTGWYRFQGAAGDRMADNCVMKYRCGTEYPGWLYGAHPTVAEGVVTRQVCYTGWVDCCYSRNNIKVQNCNGYFVYELQKPPTCNLRYCGNAGAGKLHSKSE